MSICSFFGQKTLLDGWVGGWMGGGESQVKDCLQQSKMFHSKKFQLGLSFGCLICIKTCRYYYIIYNKCLKSELFTNIVCISDMFRFQTLTVQWMSEIQAQFRPAQVAENRTFHSPRPLKKLSETILAGQSGFQKPSVVPYYLYHMIKPHCLFQLGI